MSEVGIIGQIYEDRRTKKRGRIVERDEKFKTLLMESDDGKSFNITFGSFKSNWRKLDEPEQTVEDAMEEVIPEEQITVETPVKFVEKKPKKSVSITNDEAISSALEEAVKVLVNYVSSFNSDVMQINPQFNRELISIKIEGRKFIEVFRKKNTKYYTIACKEYVANAITNFECISNLKYYPTRKPLNYAFRVNVGVFEEFLESFRSVIVNMLSDSVKEG